MSNELDRPETATTIAAAFSPEKEYEKAFFTDSPGRILAHLLKRKPQPRDILRWMADPDQLTSHSSQGQTADRVLIHVDTELGAKDLLNNRMAYVAVSRGAYDAQLFTNDSGKLGVALGRDISHRSALAPEMQPEQAIAPEIVHRHGMGIGR